MGASTAAGTVQFEDGTTALGAPVPVVGGRAFSITTTLATGMHTLTAVFTPANPALFSPSTSPPVTLTVDPSRPSDRSDLYLRSVHERDPTHPASRIQMVGPTNRFAHSGG